MALVVFDCPHCGSEIEADSSAPGARLACWNCQEVVAIPAAGIGPGTEMAGYRIEKRLGVGGMGEVFLATQIAMDRPVALKVLSPAVTGNEQFVQRFLHEIRMAGKLEHPNIVIAFDAGEVEGYYYLAMTYVRGRDVDDLLIEQEMLPELEAMRITLRVAEALDYAWQKHKLLHRDIKPGNIMIDEDGEVKLMDMGIAKSIDEESNLTQVGMLVGTPYYMSPEQAVSGRSLDFRSDIYSLGASLYRMVTGHFPFDAATAPAVLAKHISEPLVPPQSHNPQVSDGCAAIIERMMAKKPDDRYDSWQELIRDLRRQLRSASTTTDAGDIGLDDTPASGKTIGLKTPIPRNRPPSRPLAAGTAAHVAPPTEGATQLLLREEDLTDRSSAEFRNPVPPAPEGSGPWLMVIGALLVLFLIAAIGAVVFFVWRHGKDQNLAIELAKKDREIEEMRVAADVTGTALGIAREHELEKAAELRERELGKMLEEVKTWIAANPNNRLEARRRLMSIRNAAEGTRFQPLVDAEMQKLRASAAGTFGGQRPAGSVDRRSVSRNGSPVLDEVGRRMEAEPGKLADTVAYLRDQMGGMSALDRRQAAVHLQRLERDLSETQTLVGTWQLVQPTDTLKTFAITFRPGQAYTAAANGKPYDQGNYVVRGPELRLFDSQRGARNWSLVRNGNALRLAVDDDTVLILRRAD